MRKKIDITSSFYGYAENVFLLLRKIPEVAFQNLLKSYIVYLKKIKLVQGLILGFTILACIHNFFIVSDFYTADFSMQEIMIGVLVLFLIPCFIVIGILLKGQIGLRLQLRKVCKQQNLPVRKTRKEFNTYIKSHIGGYGI